MNEEVTKLAKAAMTAAVNHLEACQAGRIVNHPFVSRSLPMLQAALKEIDKPDDRPALGRDMAKKLVQFITARLERESSFLTPNPQTFMNDAYGLLDLIRNEAKLKPEDIDGWMVEAQPDKKIKGKKS